MAGRTGLSSTRMRTGSGRRPAVTRPGPRLPALWSRVRTLLRRVRWGRAAVFALAALLASLVFGITTASAEQSLGPHEARYSVTTDDLVTLDLGPLGTVEIPSPLPLTLGARITVQEIPAEVTAVDPAGTVRVLGQDLQSYVQFFAGPQAAIEDAAWAVATDALHRTLLMFVGLLVAGAVLVALLGPSRRRELAVAVSGHRPQLLRVVGIAVAVAVTCVSSVDMTARPGGGRASSSVFAGTPLDGARITGRLAGVIDTYGSMVVDAYRENEEFYDRANAAVAAAWDQRALTLAVREQDEDTAGDDAGDDDAADDDAADDAGVPAVAATDEPTDDEPADDAPADGEPTDGEPTGDQPADALVPTPTPAPTPTSTPSPTPTVGPEPVEPVDPVVMVLVSDLHCNVGMARIIRTVAERSDADIVLNAGDTTVNGTSVEQYCVTSFSQAVPPGVARVVADGNHDSLETEDQERAAGWTVLDGEVVTVEGLRILGDRDPNRTQIGGGTTPVSEETPAETGARLAGTACEGDDVDLLLIHTPRVGDAAMRTGCVAVQLSGHQHRRTGPLQVGLGIRYVSSTTAGATSGGATVGPLNGVADITVLRWDPDRGRMVDLQVVQVMPDGSATVGPREPFPQPQPVGDDGEVIEDDGQPGDEAPGDQAPGDEVPGDEATDDGIPGVPGIPGTDVTTPGTGEPTPAPTPTPASLARRTEPVAR